MSLHCSHSYTFLPEKTSALSFYAVLFLFFIGCNRNDCTFVDECAVQSDHSGIFVSEGSANSFTPIVVKPDHTEFEMERAQVEYTFDDSDKFPLFRRRNILYCREYRQYE